MIGRLSGLLLEKQPPQLLLDVSGVAYEIDAPMSTFYRLPDCGVQVTLHTHLVVREDAQLLYGFLQHGERALFRSLIKVNGVGPKLALAILSSVEPDEFARCIHDNDSAKLTRLPGIGKKTAERLIIEMRDRLDDWQTIAATTLSSTTTTRSADNNLYNKTPAQDAISALIALGYKPQEASRVVAQIDVKDLTSEEIIRLALRSAR